MENEVMLSYLITTPALLEATGMDITTKRRSLDGTLILSDFYCLTIEQVNSILTIGHSVLNFSDFDDSNVSEVNEILKDGFTLYTNEDIYPIIQSPIWTTGEL